MRTWLEMHEAKVMVGVLLRGEQVAQHVVLEGHEVLAQAINEVVARVLLQGEVQVVVDHASDGGVGSKVGLVEVLGDESDLNIHIGDKGV